MNGCLNIDRIYGCRHCGYENCDLAGQDYPSDDEIMERMGEDSSKYTSSYSGNRGEPNKKFKEQRNTKTYTCKYCGKNELIWQETPVGWRLYDKNGVPHSCEQHKNEIDNIYDAIKFLQECVYLSKPIFNSNVQIIDMIDGSSSVDIEAVKVNPRHNEVDDIQSFNTKIQIWGECGHYSLASRCWTHDVQFDVGASSLDELFIHLAKNINLKYPYLRKEHTLNEMIAILENIEEKGEDLNDEYDFPEW